MTVQEKEIIVTPSRESSSDATAGVILVFLLLAAIIGFAMWMTYKPIENSSTYVERNSEVRTLPPPVSAPAAPPVINVTPPAPAPSPAPAPTPAPEPAPEPAPQQ